MDSPNKIKIQIGDFHLETEGSEAAIEKRLSIFKDLVQIASKAGDPMRRHDKETREKEGPPPQGEPSSPLRRLFKAEGRVVTLEATPQGSTRDGDAFLLTLLGHKILRGESLIPVGEVLQGLNRSGIEVARMDEITDKLSVEFWNKVGKRRAGKFRLTVPGDKRARELAQELVSQMS